MFDSSTAGNLIQGNTIGTNAGGTIALGNAHTGMFLDLGTHDNTIGGTAAGAGNVISGNPEQGIALFDSGTTGNLIQGNFIGTDKTGTQALGKGLGVVIAGAASGNTIGGTSTGAGNLIAGNSSGGVAISGSGTTGNLLQGNLIGTDVTGTAPLGNGGNGIGIGAGASNNIIAGNTIAFSGNDGVLVDTGTGNTISRNSIFSNGNLGMELLNNGNNNQAFPVLTSATSDGNTTTLQGMLTSTPNTRFTLEFFANRVCNPSGFGEGEVFLDFRSVLTDAGNASFTFILDISVPAGQFISATATDPDGNTSQFSQCVEVTAPGAPGRAAPGRKGTTVGGVWFPQGAASGIWGASVATASGDTAPWFNPEGAPLAGGRKPTSDSSNGGTAGPSAWQRLADPGAGPVASTGADTPAAIIEMISDNEPMEIAHARTVESAWQISP